MKNITPFKIICIGLPVILIVMVLLFSKGSDAKKERLESQLQTTWHSSEEGEYNEITLAEDGTYSASGAISGTGSYRIDRNNKWIILTAENGKKNVLYYTTGKGHKVESLSMKLTVGTSTMVPRPMPEPQVDEDGSPAISQSEYDLFAATAVATMLTTRGWTCSQGSFIFQNNTIYINGKASFVAILSEASITDDGQYAFSEKHQGLAEKLQDPSAFCGDCKNYGEPNGCNRDGGYCVAWGLAQDAADILGGRE